jgi:hypothetical protein
LNLRFVPFALLALGGTAGCDSCSRSAVVVADAAPAATLVPDAAVINVAPVPTASVAKAVNPANLPGYAGPTGTIEGTISVTGDPAPATPADFKRCPDGEKVYGHAFRDGEAKTPGGSRWLADAVVAVTGYQHFFVPEKREAKLVTIEDCGFSTRTVTMTYGQRLEVKNLTKDFWTPKLEPAQSSVMMMAPPGGDAVRIYPKVAGHYHLVDHDRKYAVDDLYVFLHPLHTSSAVGGTFRIEGVPVGKVTVNTSHPGIPDAEASKEVEVTDGGVTHVDLTLNFKAPPAEASDAGSSPRLH